MEHDRVACDVQLTDRGKCFNPCLRAECAIDIVIDRPATEPCTHIGGNLDEDLARSVDWLQSRMIHRRLGARSIVRRLFGSSHDTTTVTRTSGASVTPRPFPSPS